MTVNTSGPARFSLGLGQTLERMLVMLYWAAVFFVIALVVALLGFSVMAPAAAGIAKILFFVLLGLGTLALLGRRIPI